MNTDIVYRDGDDLFTTSEVIAERADVEHRAVLQLIGKYHNDFAKFGQLAFEMRPGYNNAQVRVAKLNEQQSTLLLTFLKNTEVVRQFKVDLVKAFYQMAQQLKAPLSEDQIIAQALQITTARVQELEAQVEETAPKAEAYDSFY